MRARHARRLAALAALIAAMAALPAGARADIGETIVLRCTHGESLAGFSQSAYRRALQQLSADAEEYSGCAQAIRQAQLAAASGGRGTAAGTGTGAAVPIAASPAEQRALAGAAVAGRAAVKVDGQVINPGVVHANVASALSTLPPPLLAVLALLLAGVLVGGGLLLHRRLGGRDSG